LDSELNLIRELYRFNSEVRKKYLRAIFRKLPRSERYRDRGASFPSVVDVFVHVLDAYRWWFIFVYEDRLREYKRLREAKKYTLREVAEEERKVDERVMTFIGGLKPRDLDRTIHFHDGKTRRSIKLRAMLLQLIGEELQHRGELNALFWQLDVDPPVTNYFQWARAIK
jgi:uncharacterized damage-inducible protein DinB